MVLYLTSIFILISLLIILRPHIKDPKNMLLLFLWLLLLLTAGFRSEGVDQDYAGYIKILEGKNEYKDYIIEPTFQLLKYIINNYLNGEAIYLFLFYAAIGVTLKVVAIRHITEYSLLALLIYFIKEPTLL